MKKTSLYVCIAGAAVLFAACGGTADKSTVNNAEIANKVEKAIAAAPTKEGLIALETKAFEAWKTKDAKFWDSFLTDSFVSYADGKRRGKADEIKMLSEQKCDIKTFAFSEERMTPVGNDAVVLTAKATIDGSCGGQKLPSQSISSTLYVRSGDAWKAAYHNEVAVIDPKAPPPAKKAEPQKNVAATPTDPITESLLAVEKKGWDSWKARDSAALEAILTQDITLVDPIGTVAVGTTNVLKAWTGPKCEIKSAAPTDAAGSSVSPVVAILTYKGDATGTCDGQPLGSLWGTTIFLKEGDAWKAAYVFETPA